MRRPFVIPPEGLKVPGAGGRTRLFAGAPTIADLVRENHRLEVGCGLSQRRALIPPVIAAWILGADMPVAYAAIRFRCSVCGSGAASSNRISSRGCVEDWHADRHRLWREQSDLHPAPIPTEGAKG